MMGKVSKMTPGLMAYLKTMAAEYGDGAEGETMLSAYEEIVALRNQLANYKKAHTVHKLDENQDQTAFVFTARLQHLVSEFEGVISTAAAIGALEVVKHELIQEALNSD